MISIQSLSMDAALLTDRERTLERIYAKMYPMVRHYVKENSGTDEDAKDIFQEALITYYEKVVYDQLTLTSSLSTYLMGICKNLWRQELGKRARKTWLSDAPIDEVGEEVMVDDEQPTATLMAFVEQLGETCRSLLVSFYYFGQRLEQIAEQHGYRSVRSATVQKFKCLERLRKAVSHLSIDQFKL